MITELYKVLMALSVAVDDLDDVIDTMSGEERVEAPEAQPLIDAARLIRQAYDKVADVYDTLEG